MSLGGELGTVIEVKASAAQFHEVFSCRPHLVTSTSPGNVQSCELMEGEWGKPGSVICWTFTRGNRLFSLCTYFGHFFVIDNDYLFLC